MKTKQSLTGKVPGNNFASHRLIESPGCDIQHEGSDWVIVKKQRVTILVPAAPHSERSLTENQGPSDMHLMPPVIASNRQQLPKETSILCCTNTGTYWVRDMYQVRGYVIFLKRRMRDTKESIRKLSDMGTYRIRTDTDTSSSLEYSCNIASIVHPSGNENERTNLLAAQKEIQAKRRAPPPLPKSTLTKPSMVDQRIESEKPHQASILKSHNLLGVYDTSKVIKQPRTLLAPRRYLNLVTALNQGLRASNLERKLERAGGLSKWLTSLGLEQFVRIFQGRSLNKYCLANLTMKKLKDMGASAVGPRRKLIHAIECVCQPYCFPVL